MTLSSSDAALASSALSFILKHRGEDHGAETRVVAPRSGTVNHSGFGFPALLPDLTVGPTADDAIRYPAGARARRLCFKGGMSRALYRIECAGFILFSWLDASEVDGQP